MKSERDQASKDWLKEFSLKSWRYSKIEWIREYFSDMNLQRW